jgi:phosphopantetheine adenylyltransferase
MTEAAEREHNVLVVANETVGGWTLLNALRDRAEKEPIHVTVICPVSSPRGGYVVYEDSRRAAAGRRLDHTLRALQDANIRAHGYVVEEDPVAAVKDALAQEDVDELVVSTHPRQKSGWLRRDVVSRIREAAGDRPVEHVVVDLDPKRQRQNVLVIANETVVGDPLLARIRERADRSEASFLLICPQSDPTQGAHPEAERRLRRALALLRGTGIDAHGQISHPDPYTAAIHAIHDERVDEIIVSTFPGEKSGWLRRDVVERLRKDAGVPVEHVEVDPALVEAST